MLILIELCCHTDYLLLIHHFHISLENLQFVNLYKTLGPGGKGGGQNVGLIGQNGNICLSEGFYQIFKK